MIDLGAGVPDVHHRAYFDVFSAFRWATQEREDVTTELYAIVEAHLGIRARFWADFCYTISDTVGDAVQREATRG